MSAFIFLRLILVARMWAVSYRGKGGGWKTWGVLSQRPGDPGFNPRHWLLRLGVSASFASSSLASHGLSAIVSAAGLSLLVWSAWAMLAVPLFFLFTKPDIGTGFDIFHDGIGDDESFRADLTQKRDAWTVWAFWIADKGALLVWKLTGKRWIASWWWMTWRCGMLALPVGLFLLAFGASPWMFPAVLVIGSCYMVGRAAQLRVGLTRDVGVEVSEWAMGPFQAAGFGLMLYGRTAFETVVALFA